jgi:hypothetical protein
MHIFSSILYIQVEVAKDCMGDTLIGDLWMIHTDILTAPLSLLLREGFFDGLPLLRLHSSKDIEYY